MATALDAVKMGSNTSGTNAISNIDVESSPFLGVGVDGDDDGDARSHSVRIMADDGGGDGRVVLCWGREKC
jgi:hypothetical protein